MGNCDLCNDPIGAGARRYSAAQIRTAVKTGLRPTGGPMDAMAAVFGMSQEEAHSGWIQQVMNETTDWAMCPACAAKVDSYLAR